jgi:hypothetical protein
MAIKIYNGTGEIAMIIVPLISKSMNLNIVARKVTFMYMRKLARG